jgi:hypothetical protein
VQSRRRPLAVKTNHIGPKPRKERDGRGVVAAYSGSGGGPKSAASSSGSSWSCAGAGPGPAPRPGPDPRTMAFGRGGVWDRAVIFIRSGDPNLAYCRQPGNSRCTCSNPQEAPGRQFYTTARSSRSDVDTGKLKWHYSRLIPNEA